jgi:ATP-dependent HslUV protease subunit HslV
MSIVVGVRKAGTIAIAADSQTSQGNLLIPGDAKIAPTKIHRIGNSYFGVVGSVAHHGVIRSLLKSNPDAFDFTSAEAIFESLRSLHRTLVDDYFVRTTEDDKSQEYESNQLAGIVVSSNGVFAVESYREVTEFQRFWAAGTGAELAIGCIEAIYDDPQRSASSIAEEAVKIACRFDKDCGLPIVSYSLPGES